MFMFCGLSGKVECFARVVSECSALLACASDSDLCSCLHVYFLKRFILLVYALTKHLNRAFEETKSEKISHLVNEKPEEAVQRSLRD